MRVLRLTATQYLSILAIASPTPLSIISLDTYAFIIIQFSSACHLRKTFSFVSGIRCGRLRNVDCTLHAGRSVHSGSGYSALGATCPPLCMAQLTSHCFRVMATQRDSRTPVPLTIRRSVIDEYFLSYGFASSTQMCPENSTTELLSVTGRMQCSAYRALNYGCQVCKSCNRLSCSPQYLQC